MNSCPTFIQSSNMFYFAEAVSTPEDVLEAFAMGRGLVSVDCFLMADRSAQKLWTRGYKKGFRKEWKKHLLAERIDGEVVFYPLPSPKNAEKWVTGLNGRHLWTAAAHRQLNTLKALFDRQRRDALGMAAK